MADINDVFGTGDQVTYAQNMAKAILSSLSGAPAMPSADMAKLPGTWMYSIPPIAEALRGKQYETIAGTQRGKLRDQTLDGYTKPAAPKPVTGVLSQSAPQGTGNIQTSALPPDNEDTGTGQNPITQGFFDKVRKIESSGNDNLVNQYGYRGRYQFSPKLWSQYGGGADWRNGDAQDKAALAYFSDLRNQFVQKNNREPTEGELYLMHQRGPGGQQMGMDNPDRPEWVNMYETKEGKQRALSRGKEEAIAWAQRTVKANVPKNDPTRKQLEQQYGSDWYLHMTSKQFQPIWLNRFNNAGPTKVGDTITGAEGQDSMAGGSDPLSGEGTSDIETGATKVAQNAPGFQTTTPTRTGPTSDIPPPNPIESEAQLRARLRNAESEDQVRQITEDYMKRKEGRAYQGIGTTTHVTPNEPGKQPTVSEYASKTVPFQLGELGLHLIPKPNGGFQAAIPGGGTKDFKDINELMEWLRQQKGMTTDVIKRAEKGADRYENVQAHAEQTYQGTKDRGRQLALAQQLVNDPKFISGSAQEVRERINKFFTTIGVEPPASGADVTQAFVKLVSGNILDDIKGLGGQGLGQIRAKEMEIIEKMNAMPQMSPGAVRAVITLTKKINDRMDAQNEKILDYTAEHGKIDGKFYQEMRKYYAENPLISDNEISNYKELFKTQAKLPGDTTTSKPGENKPGEKKTPEIYWDPVEKKYKTR